jgi:hypothetical protein
MNVEQGSTNDRHGFNLGLLISHRAHRARRKKIKKLCDLCELCER